MKTVLHYFIEKEPAIKKLTEIWLDHQHCEEMRNFPFGQTVNEIVGLQPGESLEIGLEGTWEDIGDGQIVISIEIPDSDGHVLATESKTITV